MSDLMPVWHWRVWTNGAWWKAEALYLVYRTGLRGYCFQHDTLRWRWTHRDCCWEERALLAAILDEWFGG